MANKIYNEAGEEVAKVGEKLGIFARFFGKTDAKIAEKAAADAARAEPSLGDMGNTAKTEKPRVNPNSQEYKDYLAKEKAAKAEADAAAGGANPKGEPKGKESPQPKPEADPESLETAADATKRMNWWPRTKMFYRRPTSENTLTSDLAAIMRKNGGSVKETDTVAMNDMKKVLSKHRLYGVSPEEARILQRETGIPESIRERAQLYADRNDKNLRTFWSSGYEWGAARANYLLNYPVVGSGQLLMKPVTDSVAKRGIVKTVAIAAALDGGVHYAASGPDKGVKDAATAVGHDVIAIPVGIGRGIGWGVSQIPTDWAKEAGQKMMQAAPGVAMSGFNLVDQAGTGLFDGTTSQIATELGGPTDKADSSKKEGGDKVSLYRDAKIAGSVVEEVNKKLNPGKKDETGTEAAPEAEAKSEKAPEANQPSPAKAAGAPVGINDDPADDESEEDFKKRATAHMSIPEQLKWAKDRAIALKEKESGAMQTIKDNMQGPDGWKYALGALFGFDKAKGVARSLPAMGIMSLLIKTLIDGISGMFGGGRGSYDKHNQTIAATQAYYGQQRGNAPLASPDFTPNGVSVGNSPRMISPPVMNGPSSGVTFTPYGVQGQPAAPIQRYYNEGPATPAVTSPAPERAPLDIGAPQASATPNVQVKGIERTYEVDAPAVAANPAPKVKRDNVPEPMTLSFT